MRWDLRPSKESPRSRRNVTGKNIMWEDVGMVLMKIDFFLAGNGRRAM